MPFLLPLKITPWYLAQSDCHPKYLQEYLSLEDKPECKLLQEMFKNENGVKDYRWDYKLPEFSPNPSIANLQRNNWRRFENYTGIFTFNNMAELYEPAKGKDDRYEPGIYPKYEDCNTKTNNVQTSRLRPPVMVSRLGRITALAKLAAATKEIRKVIMNREVRKLVVFTLHRDVIWIMREFMRDIGVISLYQSMTEEKKERYLSLFKKWQKYKVLICHTYTNDLDGIQDACNHAVFVQAPWDEQKVYSCIKLLHRRRQIFPVDVKFMCIEGTVDEEIQKALIKKVNTLRLK